MAEQKGRVSSKRSVKTRYKDLDKKFKFLIVFGIIFCIAGVPMIIWGGIWAYNTYAIGGEVPEEEELPIDKLTSTFELTSSVSRDVVSNIVTMDIWGQKDNADFSLGMEDVTDIETNFERIETNVHADDIAIDLRDGDYYWAEITGNSVFNNTFRLLYGHGNYDYKWDVHDSSSALPFNVYVKGTGANLTIYTETVGGSLDANYTGVLDVPIDSETPADCHYGEGWPLSTTEFDALSLRQKEVYWDEGNWCDQWVTYDPTLDTIGKYDREWERVTNVPALKFVMNDTISVVDGEATQINCTIARGYSIEYLVSGVNLYMAWYNGFNFKPDPYTFDFEIWFGVNISVRTVYSGRANVFGSLSSLTWDRTYNEIGLVAS